jgi:hypothetical protein
MHLLGFISVCVWTQEFFDKIRYNFKSHDKIYTLEVQNFEISKSKKKFRNFGLGFGKKTKFEISKKKFRNFFLDFEMYVI